MFVLSTHDNVVQLRRKFESFVGSVLAMWLIPVDHTASNTPVLLSDHRWWEVLGMLSILNTATRVESISAKPPQKDYVYQTYIHACILCVKSGIRCHLKIAAIQLTCQCQCTILYYSVTWTEIKFNHRLADQLTLYQNITFFACQKLIRINGPNST